MQKSFNAYLEAYSMAYETYDAEILKQQAREDIKALSDQAHAEQLRKERQQQKSPQSQEDIPHERG